MLFNSLAFALFLPVVFGLHWAARSKRQQNLVLLGASYLFYGWWDWRFLTLIALSSGLDFVLGKRIAATEDLRRRRAFLVVSLAVNLGALGFFKYFNFFAESLRTALAGVGIEAGQTTLSIVLPVGISFYTFQTLSYTIDVYRRRMPVHDDVIAFFTFVAFFPQLVAGPIERASNLLGQFDEKRAFDEELAKDGLRQMLWGFFKKLVVADTLALTVNATYANPEGQSGAVLLVATLFFAFQIYCDFSGYSDIAIGCAKLFRIRLMRNFAYPYFAANIAEFWKRWHISLSTWFSDYVYVPLGGGRYGQWKKLRNVFVVFLVSGLWHGANWTFVVWGAIHALMYVPVVLFGAEKNKGNAPGGKGLLPSPVLAAKIFGTFVVVTLAWVFFRAASVTQALDILYAIFTQTSPVEVVRALGPKPVLVIGLLVVIEWLRRSRDHALEVQHLPVAVRWILYALVVVSLLFLGRFSDEPFLYFQF